MVCITAASKTVAATLLTTYNHVKGTGKLHSNHADSVLRSQERAADRQCRSDKCPSDSRQQWRVVCVRDAFRMLEDICNVLTVLVTSHGTKIFEVCSRHQPCDCWSLFSTYYVQYSLQYSEQWCVHWRSLRCEYCLLVWYCPILVAHNRQHVAAKVDKVDWIMRGKYEGKF